MFTLIANGCAWIGGKLAAPLNWFLSLPFWDWQVPIIILVLLVFFSGRLMITSVRTVIRTRAAIEDVRFNREWTGIGGLNDAEFEDRMLALKDKADRKDDEAKELEEIDEERRLWMVPGASRKLLKEADKCRQYSDDIRSEIDRLRALRAEYKKREAELGGDIGRILGLIRQLNAANPHAQNALAQLNKVATSIDWLRLAPAKFPEHTRQVMAKTLRTMASTPNVNEARNAYGRVSQMLQNHRMNWEDLAA
jgi:hypothetical protein